MNMEEITQMTKLEERAEKAETELNNEWEASRFLQAKLNTAEARVKELEEALRECCRMFEWCDTRYGQLIKTGR